MRFHEVRFPAVPASGIEACNMPWAHGRRRYDAGLGLRSLDDVHAVLAFFEARMGRLYGFRWKDWADHKSCAPSKTPGPTDCALGAGDGTRTAFQLVKPYVSGPGRYERPITKPVAWTVRAAVGGVEVEEGAGFLVDHATGVLTFDAAPTEGALVTAGFAFDVPVRFDADRIEVNLAAFAVGEFPSIPVVEVRDGARPIWRKNRD